MAKVVQLVMASGAPVCERCLLATNPVLRLRGLLGRTKLPRGDGILLNPCGSVHTFFMRFPIDVVFCDRQMTVLSVASEVPPWRVRSQRRASVVIELAAGEALHRGVVAGVQIVAT
jgi:uncharacterized membrane protein (UPF0127 family)